MTAPVVVTGLGVVCSIASDPDSFATALRAGVCGIRPADDPAAPPYAARLHDFTLAGALSSLTGAPEPLRQRAARAAARSPLAIQAAAVSSLQAWESAGLHDRHLPGDRLGVVVGGSNLTGRYAEQMRPKFDANPAYLPASFALHACDTDHVGTLSEVLGITGEGWTVGGASASGNLAIIHAARLVGAGVVDACLAVGALTDLSALETRGLLNLGAMAGPCQPRPGQAGAAGTPGAPFDTSHRGFVPGEAAACLVVESAASAAARTAPVLASIAGYDLKLDANRLADPSEPGEARVIANALRNAGVSAGEVSYVNAHGSGSPLGDRVEAAALARALGPAAGVPWVNATKGLTGHCLSAAGVVEAVATILQMRHGFVHPNVGLEHPVSTSCRFAGPAARPAEIAVAVSNSFGFGGLNSSVVLRRAPR